MKKLLYGLLLSVLFPFASSKSVAQNSNNDSTLNCTIFTTEINQKGAEKDISNNSIKLYLWSGDAPVSYYPNDSIFEAKYGVVFYDFGCVAEVDCKCMKEYNRTIYKYLDKMYGRKWRKQIRRDVIGFRRRRNCD